MENETGWGSYAEKTFTSLIKETKVATYVASQHVENAKIKCVNAFVEGLKAGVVTMKLVLPRYKKNSREGNWGDTAKIIAARIDAIPYPV